MLQISSYRTATPMSSLSLQNIMGFEWPPFGYPLDNAFEYLLGVPVGYPVAIWWRTAEPELPRGSCTYQPSSGGFVCMRSRDQSKYLKATSNRREASALRLLQL